MNLAVRIGARIRALSGWRRLGLAFAMGALSALAFTPPEIFPLLLLGYGALVLLIDGADAGPRPVRRAAAAGWAFCFGQFLVGLHWIGFAFLVDPSNHLWQMPFAVTALPAGLALYGALACGLAAYFWQNGPARLFVFAVFMAGGEWLRGHLFTGFPWNLSAYGWGASLALLQSVSLMGSYGLSFLTILLGASLAELAARRWKATTALVLVFAGLWTFGVYRLATTPLASVRGVVLRLVQPDIPQKEKFVRSLMLRNWRRLVELSIRPPDKALGPPTHIVWPEAATGFAVARSAGALDQIALFTMRGQTLLTGSVRVEATPEGRAWYNSLYLFGPHGALPLVYDKFHLVPFGEYVPYAQTLAKIGITQVTTGEGASAGDHPHVLAVPGAPDVTPLICYEVIFPHDVTDPGAPRPGWFVNVTDDSWFGPWAGPRQHFLTARVRAIEEGLPIARAANTGISAVIDGNGRVRASLPLGAMGVVDARLPRALAPTPYARFGDLVFLLFLAIGALCVFVLGRKPGGAPAPRN
jgi:apolipoprotein N-acyltransferase